MRKHYFILYGALLLTLFACTKTPQNSPDLPDPDPEPDTVQHVIELGKVSMKRDGIPWSGSFKAYSTNSKYVKIFATYTFPNGITENFNIRDIPKEIGLHGMERGDGFSVNNGVPQVDLGWLLDNDQVLGILLTDTIKHVNFINVMRFDSLNEVIEGSFNFYLSNAFSSSNSEFGLPDSLHITEGKFHLKLE